MSQGDQFDFLPSSNLGMGGLSISSPDSLLDPFRNPATIARLKSRLFGSPGVYSVSSQAGNGRTLPLGAFLHAGGWFGSGFVAVQEVHGGEPALNFFPVLARTSVEPAIFPQQSAAPGGPQINNNLFAQAMLGRELSGGFSVAGSVSWARLRALDGVDLMYANAGSVDQAGGSFDARLGVLRQGARGQTFEAVVVHNRYDMAHDVMYLDPVWDPATQQIISMPRQELNQDQTNTWGLHVQQLMPIAQSGWNFGWLATANRMSHPKIPNYSLMNIPRDPGYSSAFNIGVGLGRRDGASSFGVEIVHEPIWSHTWAEAEAPIVTPTGTIPLKGRTIENRFRFSNGLVRMGVGRDFEMAAGKSIGVQMGLVVRGVRYHLRQENHVESTLRRMNQSWTEWTPTWGLDMRFPEFEIRYRGAATNGGGRPGVGDFGVCREICTTSGGDRGVIVAPSGPLQLTDVTVISHQVSFAIPLARSQPAGGVR